MQGLESCLLGRVLQCVAVCCSVLHKLFQCVAACCSVACLPCIIHWSTTHDIIPLVLSFVVDQQISFAHIRRQMSFAHIRVYPCCGPEETGDVCVQMSFAHSCHLLWTNKCHLHTLQHTAKHCNTLQCVAVFCSVLQGVGPTNVICTHPYTYVACLLWSTTNDIIALTHYVCCGVLQCGAMCCVVLPSAADCCSVVPRVAVCYRLCIIHWSKINGIIPLTQWPSEIYVSFQIALWICASFFHLNGIMDIYIYICIYIWVHLTYHCITPSMEESCHTRMSHITHECVMSRVTASL